MRSRWLACLPILALLALPGAALAQKAGTPPTLTVRARSLDSFLEGGKLLTEALDDDPNADRSPQLMTLVEFQLEEIPEGTRLTITESGFDRLPKERSAKVFEENDEGWKIQTRLVDEYVRRLVGAGR